MIGLPFNDTRCLGAITEIAAGMVATRDEVLVELAAKHPSVESLTTWIRSLPQLDDDGSAHPDEQVRTCRPAQRLRLPAEDPNCVERAALYLAVAELIDPTPARQLATLDTPLGLHTFPVENGQPIILDPQMPRNCLTCGLAAASTGPVAVAPQDAIGWVAQLAAVGATPVRNGPARFHRARNALMQAAEGHVPDPDTVEDMAWLFALASQESRRYGARALSIVRSTAQAIADLVDDIAARRAPRNLALEIGGKRIMPTPWASALATTTARIGAQVGAVALRAKLASLGIDAPVLDAVEHELNREGLTMGAVARPSPGFSSLAAFIKPRAA